MSPAHIIEYAFFHVACGVVGAGMINCDYRGIYGNLLDDAFAKTCWCHAVLLGLGGPACLISAILPPRSKWGWTLSRAGVAQPNRGTPQ